MLHELLATIGSDTRLSDIFDALVESESACLREEIGGEVYGAIGGRPALVLVSSPLDLISAFCVEPQRKGDIIVAVMATAVSGLSGETEACIRNEIIENYGDDSSGSFLYGPSYLNCLNQTQIIELTIYELAWEAGNVGSETRDCMRQAMAAGFGAADRLSSGNPQDSLVITIAFQEVAIYGCLSTEQIAPFFGVEATDIPVIECLRYMYAERFPRLYNNVGAKMFGSGLDLSPKEQESLESFWDSRQECETDPPAYPTPKAPGPTLRPGVLAELRSTSTDENTSVGSVIALLPKDGAACLRDQLGSRLYSETAYERFLAAPAVSLTSIPISLWNCFGEEVRADVTAQVILASAEIRNAGVETCLLEEFAELGDTHQAHYNLPAWRLDKPYFRCLNEEDYQQLAIAQLTASVGQLSAESETCAREIAADGFNIARRIDRYIGSLSAVFDTTAYHLCLSDAQFDEFYQIVASRDGINLRTYHRDCMRTVYDESVAKLRAEDDESAWEKGDSPAASAFWDDIRGCKAQP